MHLNSELLFRKYSAPYFKDHFKVLEIGPAGHPTAYQQMVNNPLLDWHTIDFADTTFVGNAAGNLTYTLTDPYEFPVDSDSYDILISGQVIEHVEKIWTWMKEIKRVLKPGGRVITINPVSWPYHEAPIDCWRIFPSGIRALAGESDMEIELNLFESLEVAHIRDRDQKAVIIPGMSYNYLSSDRHLSTIIRWNKLIRRFPILGPSLEIPIQVAYDTISVLKKPGSEVRKSET